MGFVKKAVKKVANVATGGLYSAYEKKKKAKRDAKREARRMEAEERKNQELANQSMRHDRQEDADLAALERDPGSVGDEMGGILTSPQGLVDDRKLSKKKKLGGE